MIYRETEKEMRKRERHRQVRVQQREMKQNDEDQTNKGRIEKRRKTRGKQLVQKANRDIDRKKWTNKERKDKREISGRQMLVALKLYQRSEKGTTFASNTLYF